MTKNDLINLTLKQLKESLRHSPECLHIEDPELNQNTYQGPTIVWKFRVEVDGMYIQDPNNAARTIIVYLNQNAMTLTANIFLREVSSVHHSIMADATASIKYRGWPWLYSSYRSFMSLRKQLIKRHREKESLEFMRKLTSIFPSTGDDDWLR